MKKQRKLDLRKVNVATINNLTNKIGGQTNPNDPSAICITDVDCHNTAGCNSDITGCYTAEYCEHTVDRDTCNVTKRTAFSNFAGCGAC